MAKYSTNSLGFDLSFSGPGSIEDYDKLAGVRPSGVSAALEDAVTNEIYRGTLPDWQEAFAKRVAELYPDVKREVNTEATAKLKAASKSPENVKDVLETVKKYVNRVLAGLDDEQKKALAAEAQAVADNITIDPSPSKRQGAPKKDELAKADQWLGLSDEELEAKIENAQKAGVNYELVRDSEGRPERDSLARFIGRFIDVLKATV